MFDDHHGVAALDQIAKGLDQLIDIGPMQSGGRLVEEKETSGFRLRMFRQKRRQLQALCLSARKRSGRLPEA